MKRVVLVAVLLSWLTTIAAIVAVPSSAFAGPAGAPAAHIALFEGHWIDFSSAWRPARDCDILPGRPPVCFRTEVAARAGGAHMQQPAVSCSTPLRLHNGTNQTGATLSIYTRGVWVDLADWGFDNMTSSYTVGACAIELASLAGGGGFRYTRCLSAGCVENVMDNGWNNVVSSVYLH
jgi:hypothetical protein